MKDSRFDMLWRVIPVFNEGPVIADLAPAVMQGCPNLVPVREGARDETAEHAQAAGERA